jgi:hypothetical protein
MWSKRRLAQELASRLKKQFEADLEQAKEDLKWKNIKKGFNDQLEQFGRDVSRVPEAYQASWRDLRDKMPELSPVQAAGLVKQGFVANVMQTVDRVTGELEPAAPAAASPPPGKSQPERGGRDTASSRDDAYRILTTTWRPRLELALEKLDRLSDLSSRLRRRDPDNGFTQTPHVATIASPVTELTRLLRDAGQEDLRRECQALAGRLSEGTWSGLPETSSTPSGDSRRSVLRACAEFFGKAGRDEDELVECVQAAAARCRGRINFDVLKGYVLGEPEDRAERCEQVRAYANWGLDLLAEIQVPDYHRQAAEIAITACREALQVLTAFAEKQALSITVTDAVRKYEQSQPYDQIYQLLKPGKPQYDPAKPQAADGRPQADQDERRQKAVELLADKIVKSVELGLNSARPLVAAFDRAVGISEISLATGTWGSASAAAVTAVHEHVDEHLGEAQARLAELKTATEINDEHPVWMAINNVLTGGRTAISAKIEESLTGKVEGYIKARKESIQAHLDQPAGGAGPSGTAGQHGTGRKVRSPSRDGAALILLEQINGKLVVPLVKVIVDNVPVTPAEPVSSERAQTLIANLSKSFGSRPIAIAQTGEFRPARDNRGRRVECLLSAKPREYAGDLEKNLGRLCYDVRMAEPQLGRGYLFLDNLEFEAAPQYLGSEHADPYAGLPEKDAGGRRISEFKPDPTALAIGPYGYKVRIGELWGYLDRYKVFTPRDVDEHALADWRKRVLIPGQSGQGQVKAGYRSEQGELVEGNWYRPLSQGRSYFLFMPKAGGWHEWAREDMTTGQETTVGRTLERVTWEGIKAFRSVWTQ